MGNWHNFTMQYILQKGKNWEEMSLDKFNVLVHNKFCLFCWSDAQSTMLSQVMAEWARSYKEVWID